MEESIKLTGVFSQDYMDKAKHNLIDTSNQDPFLMNALTLAYVGDSVFELMARIHCLMTGSHQMAKLHRHVISLVNASSQAEMSDVLMDKLDEKEAAIFRRGRNSTPGNLSKHQNIGDYKKATGLEAVFGYLYLSGQYERMRELFLICADTVRENSGEADKDLFQTGKIRSRLC